VQTNIRTTTRLRRTIPKKIQKKGEDFQLLVRHKLHVKSRRSCCYECNLGQEPRSYRSFSFENPSNIIMLIRVCRCLPDCGALCHERSQVKKLLPSNEWMNDWSALAHGTSSASSDTTRSKSRKRSNKLQTRSNLTKLSTMSAGTPRRSCSFLSGRRRTSWSTSQSPLLIFNVLPPSNTHQVQLFLAFAYG